MKNKTAQSTSFFRKSLYCTTSAWDENVLLGGESLTISGNDVCSLRINANLFNYTPQFNAQGYVHITLFSFWSVFGSKNGAAFFSVHTTPFSDRNGYLSIGVHTISQKLICFSFWKRGLQGFWYWRFQIVPFLVFTLRELRFCLALFSFSSIFTIVFI